MATAKDAVSIVSGDAAISEEARKSELQKILEEKKSTKVAADTAISDKAKLRGLNRELYNLVGERVPLAAASGYSRRKAELSKRSAATKWVWAPFRNRARKQDQLMLCHWVKESNKDMDYPFAKFDKASRVPVYTRDTYLMHLCDDDWSEEETTLLFDLCRKYDLRFVVVHDRFMNSNLNSKKKRSIEDLKARYYSVGTKVAKVHGSRPQVDASYRYDATHETKRKQQLATLAGRTLAQIHEEELLTAELKKINQSKKDRENVMKALKRKSLDDDSRKRKSSSDPKRDKDKLFGKYAQLRPPPPSVTHLRSAVVHRALSVRPPKLAQMVADMCQENGISLPMPTQATDIVFEKLRKTLLQNIQLMADSKR